MTFCAAPFVHMVQNPDGQYRTCCMYEKPLEGKYANIKDAFESEENQVIRNRMLSGETLEECRKCDIDELHGGKTRRSYRSEFNEKYEGFDYLTTPRFKTLEISVSNKCNFKCIDCGPRFSNQFGPTITNNLPDVDDFKDLQFLKILGGEPFLDKKNIELFKLIPRKNIELMLVTNNSIFPNQEVLQLLSEFKKLNINISIDGIQEVAEYVRNGTKWERFERNWIKWNDWISNHSNSTLVPHFVFHSLNAPFFDATYAWAKLSLDKWSWDTLVSPEWLNMSYLPDNIKQFILDNNKILYKPLKKFLSMNSFDVNYYHALLQNISGTLDILDFPHIMEDYMDQFFRKI